MTMPTSTMSRQFLKQASRRTFTTSRAARQSSTTGGKGTTEGMDWPTYFSYRKSRRRWGVLASIPTTLLGFTIGATQLATIEAEPTDLIMGIDPRYAYAIGTIGCVGLGYVLGPSFGNSMWRLAHRRVLPTIEAKDKDFYRHVVKNRVDPSRQSVSNPVPDFYCEKPGSLREYRQWLRDQSAYRRKAQFGDADAL